MTKEEFESLRPGDVVEVEFDHHKKLYTVKGNNGRWILTYKGHRFVNFKIKLIQEAD